MDLGLTGKIALVTGGSRGIGRAIAECLAAEGCDVILVGRDEAAVQSAAGALSDATGRRAISIAADLRCPNEIDDLAAEICNTSGRLDILVNNAGATKRGNFFELKDEDWLDGFALKFFGYVRLTRVLWPLLKSAGGSLINIVGVGARTPSAEFTIGSSVNAGLLAFTKSMASIGLADGVRVNAVNPGAIQTDRLSDAIDAHAEAVGITPAEARDEILRSMGVTRFGQPVEIGAVVAFLSGTPSAYVHGSLIDIDGGWTRGL